MYCGTHFLFTFRTWILIKGNALAWRGNRGKLMTVYSLKEWTGPLAWQLNFLLTLLTLWGAHLLHDQRDNSLTFGEHGRPGLCTTEDESLGYSCYFSFSIRHLLSTATTSLSSTTGSGENRGILFFWYSTLWKISSLISKNFNFKWVGIGDMYGDENWRGSPDDVSFHP